MLRYALAFVAAVALMAPLSVQAEGRISSDTLAAMGLGGMQTMTADEAMEVRGKYVKKGGKNHGGKNHGKVQTSTLAWGEVDLNIKNSNVSGGYEANGKTFATGSVKGNLTQTTATTWPPSLTVKNVTGKVSSFAITK